MSPREPADPICTICSEVVASGVPVVFDHGDTVHLDCYVGNEGAAVLLRNFLESRPEERFCYTCVAQHLTGERREIEKASIALRLKKSVAVEPGFCSTCRRARVTIQADRTRLG